MMAYIYRMERNEAILRVAFCLTLLCGLSGWGQPQDGRQGKSIQNRSQCEEVPDHWQRFALVNAKNIVFKLDVYTGDTWMEVSRNQPSIHWVRVHWGDNTKPISVCPRFKIVEAKSDISVYSPYDPQVAHPQPFPGDFQPIDTGAYLIDTATGDAWGYTINAGFTGKPLQDLTPVQ